jgi:predicted  nucleic acid-binding Zn-ribbon protein
MDITESADIGSDNYEDWKRIAELEAELTALKHDHSRLQDRCTELVNENEALREKAQAAYDGWLSGGFVTKPMAELKKVLEEGNA